MLMVLEKGAKQRRRGLRRRRQRHGRLSFLLITQRSERALSFKRFTLHVAQMTL